MTITSAALMAARSSTATGDLSDAVQGRILQLRARVLIVGLTVTKQAIGALTVAEPMSHTSTTPRGARLHDTRSTYTSTFMRNRARHRPARDTKADSQGEMTLRNGHTVVMNDVRVTTLRALVHSHSQCRLAGSRSITDVSARPPTLGAGAALIPQTAAARPTRAAVAGGVFRGGDAN
ncbi:MULTISPECIES: hypothetical protein [Corynebacterium]|uniref:hypothetical protein n=1 Tax=Corynebacterium TaxID=1716 RepID=UPI001EF744FA|nr:MULTISPECIES: hypothetical protein [Corynebacterium]